MLFGCKRVTGALVVFSGMGPELQNWTTLTAAPHAGGSKYAAGYGIHTVSTR